jgi:alpha-L-fucosidase
VERFAIDAWRDGDWHEIVNGASVGNLRLLRVGGQVTHKVRLRITQAPVCPAIAEVSLFASRDS